MDSKRKLIVGVFALLVVMTMGYALFSETVTIGGTAKGEGNLSVIFNEIDKENGVYNSAGVTINKLSINNGKTLDIDMTMDYPGAMLQVLVPIQNNGSIDAYFKNVKIEGLDLIDSYLENPTGKEIYIMIGDEEHSNPVDISKFEGMELKVGETKNIIIYILWNDQIPNTNQNKNLKFNVALDFEQLVNSDIPGGGSAKPGYKYAIGDKICFSNECFKIIGNDKTNVRAIAAKNITTSIGTDVDPIYPKQSDTAGEISFAQPKNNKREGYWVDDNSNLLPKYKNEYLYDNNSLLFPIVQKYEEYLKKILHVNVLKTDLASYNEVLKMGECSSFYSTYKCNASPTNFLGNQEFWFGDLIYDIHTIGIYSVEGNNTEISGRFFDDKSGVRPVITIPISEVEKAY